MIGLASHSRGDCLRGVTGNAGDIAVMPVTPNRLPSAPPPEGEWGLLLSRASSLQCAGAPPALLRRDGRNPCGAQPLHRGRPSGRRGMADDRIAALTPALRSALVHPSMYHWWSSVPSWTPA